MHGMKRGICRDGRRPQMRGQFGGERRGHGEGGIGGGRRGKRFAGEELKLMVLAMLAESAPQHGYQLIRGFAEKSGEAYVPSPGVLYPLLTMLQDMGLVDEAPGEGRTRSVTLSDAGRAELAKGRDAADAAFARLSAIAEEAGRSNAAPIRRAMMNLRAASIQRMSAANADNQTAFAIADLIDEAARKIERF